MRALVSLVLAVAVALGVYYFYLKRSQPSGVGNLPAQAVTTTGVQNDLLAIAQAERLYFAEKGSYASMSELTASGALSLTRSGRDGYTYSVETTAHGFTVTARYTGLPGDAPGVHYPKLIVDQTMQIRQSD